MPERRYPAGAEIISGGTSSFRVWAPGKRTLDVVIDGGETVSLKNEGNGYFSGTAPAAAGARYWFRIDGGEPRPDPASRYQPEGPHGPSEVVDPSFPWTDAAWRGAESRGQVIYEMHVGTFTAEGTFPAAERELAALRDVGVTLIEIMPLADFAGRFGWGYDGVNLYAPTRLYGTPHDLRRFIDRAHATGLGVILDVVYNHLGPSGNYLADFSECFISSRHVSEWGDSPNFDGEQCGAVREFISANARYWIEEFHFDGLRLDATQQVFDDSPEHILCAVTREAKAAGRGRAIYVTAENEPQDVKLIEDCRSGGYGIDSLWNDDFHHSAVVALSGRNEAYYTDYLGAPQEFISAAKRGFLYQGQHYEWQGDRRGTASLDTPPWRMVTFIENHDQVANSARGQRSHAATSPGRHRAMTALLLLGPQTPMLFQGQEFGADTPFFYFADHEAGLATDVSEGRKQFLRQFRTLATPQMQSLIPDPLDPSTFERCKLVRHDDESSRRSRALHRDLLALRREDPTIRIAEIDGAVLGTEALVLRFFGPDHDDRLLIVNFGRDLRLRPAPEPLLAPPAGRKWEIRWSSEDPAYGGSGTAIPDSYLNWWIPGHSAVLLEPAGREGVA